MAQYYGAATANKPPTTQLPPDTQSKLASARGPATGGDAFGTLSRPDAKTLMTKLSRSAKTEESRTLCDTIGEALGLN